MPSPFSVKHRKRKGRVKFRLTMAYRRLTYSGGNLSPHFMQMMLTLPMPIRTQLLTFETVIFHMHLPTVDNKNTSQQSLYRLMRMCPPMMGTACIFIIYPSSAHAGRSFMRATKELLVARLSTYWAGAGRASVVFSLRQCYPARLRMAIDMQGNQLTNNKSKVRQGFT